MNAQDNSKRVQQMYAEFQKGNISAVLDNLTADVEWKDAAKPPIPYAGTKHGIKEVGEYFKKLDQAQEFLTFEPKEFIAQDGTVVALGHLKARIKSTNKTVESDWTMTFHFKDGKVNEFRSCYDVDAALQAFRP